MKEERTNEKKEPLKYRITLMATSLLPLISNEGITSLPVDLATEWLRFLQYDWASQSYKLLAVEVVGVSMH